MRSRYHKKEIIDEMSYVCTPSNFKIRMKYQLLKEKRHTAKRIKMYIYDNDKVIYSKHFKNFQKAPTSRFDYDDMLKRILKNMFELNRDSFNTYITKNSQHGLYFYDSLKRVQSKLGTTIFRKN